MRTEEDVNENEEHFVSVEARVASLPRGCGAVCIFMLLVSLLRNWSYRMY